MSPRTHLPITPYVSYEPFYFWRYSLLYSTLQLHHILFCSLVVFLTLKRILVYEKLQKNIHNITIICEFKVIQKSIYSYDALLIWIQFFFVFAAVKIANRIAMSLMNGNQKIVGSHKITHYIKQ